MTTRYLLFDSSCSVCTDLAQSIERESDGELLGRSLYDPEAQALLDKTGAKGRFEPTLIEVEGERVKAYTGLGMRLRLLTTMSPRRVYKIARIVQKAGVSLLGLDAAAPEAEQAPAAPPASSTERPAAAAPSATELPAQPHEPPIGFRMTDEGLELGTPAPVDQVTTITGETLSLRGEGASETVVVFLSTGCPACRRVAETLREFYDGAPERVIIIFSAVKQQKFEEFVAAYSLDKMPIVISPETRVAFGVRGVPYGFALDRTGTIRGKGIVNVREHLEDLAHTLWFDIETIQQLLSLSERVVVDPAPKAATD